MKMKMKTYKYLGVAMFGLMSLSIVGCTDTLEEHNRPNHSNATQSLWQIISSNENMSNFAQLAEMVHYHRDEKHPQKNYTFRDLLNSKQSFTVWAPTNDAYSEAQWAAWKELAKTSPYSVQQQLLGNSIAVSRMNISESRIDTITMLNGKKHSFDRGAAIISSEHITQKNIAASNGTLHILGHFLPFKFNLYEYMKDITSAKEQNFNLLRNFILKNDTTYFSEALSIEGTPDENGNPTYVDSVYMTANNLFFGTKRFPNNTNTDQYLTYDESFGNNISREDSSYILIVPTDQAWEKARKQLAPYYKYANVYVDNEKEDLKTSGVVEATRETGNADSLTQKNIDMDILSPLLFNVNLQPNTAGQLGTWKSEEFLKNSAKAKFFRNTYGDTLRSDNNWQKESLFQGNPMKMSNGYAILAEEWNLPRKFYKPDVNVEVNYGTIYKFKEYTDSKKQTIKGIGFSNNLAKNWIDSVGRVSHDNYYEFQPNGDNALSVSFKLRGNDQEIQETEVMSGKYDIYVVLVPSFYSTSVDTIDQEATRYKAKIRAEINYIDNANSGKTSKKKSDNFSVYDEFSGEKVDTILLFKDFEFPYSYKNLRHSYPTLTITTKKPNSTERRNNYRPFLNIDRIILKSKD